MHLATVFLVIWLALLLVNLVSWMRVLSWHREDSARFFYYPQYGMGRLVAYIAAAAVAISALAGILSSESAFAARSAHYLSPYAIFFALSALCCYSLWRRHAKV